MSILRRRITEARFRRGMENSTVVSVSGRILPARNILIFIARLFTINTLNKPCTSLNPAYIYFYWILSGKFSVLSPGISGLWGDPIQSNCCDIYFQFAEAIIAFSPLQLCRAITISCKAVTAARKYLTNWGWLGKRRNSPASTYTGGLRLPPWRSRRRWKVYKRQDLKDKADAFKSSELMLLFSLSESGKFTGSLPLSYYNRMGVELENYDPSEEDRARRGVGGGGIVNNNSFCFPIVIRSRLSGGVKVFLGSVLRWPSLKISDSNVEHPWKYLVAKKYHGIEIIIKNVEGNSLFDLTALTDLDAMCICIQEKFDQTFGHSWNIICGEAFSTSLTFQVYHF